MIILKADLNASVMKDGTETDFSAKILTSARLVSISVMITLNAKILSSEEVMIASVTTAGRETDFPVPMLTSALMPI